MMQKGIEIKDFPAEGYQPLVDYGGWRVAVLKFCDDLLIENVKTMQKHLYTDEVFVLVQGNCTLFLAGDGDLPGTITAVKMEPHKVYNIKKGTWHNHIMDSNGEVVIVENQETRDTEDNSPIRPLSDAQLTELAESIK
jgi:ureidoglycolate hydrolase